MAEPEEPRASAGERAQADGTPASRRTESGSGREASSAAHVFSASGTWSGGGDGCGQLRLPQADATIAIGGAKELGGCGIGSNPEELLVGAIAACFLNTWAIFLKKLQLTYAEPSVRVTAELTNDPAGGYKLASAKIRVLVPSSLWAESREKIEKTLSLTEKYCIISKVVRAAMPLKVEVEEV